MYGWATRDRRRVPTLVCLIQTNVQKRRRAPRINILTALPVRPEVEPVEVASAGRMRQNLPVRHTANVVGTPLSEVRRVCRQERPRLPHRSVLTARIMIVMER